MLDIFKVSVWWDGFDGHEASRHYTYKSEADALDRLVLCGQMGWDFVLWQWSCDESEPEWLLIEASLDGRKKM